MVGIDDQFAYVSFHLQQTLSEGLFAGMTDSVSRRLFVFTEQVGNWKIWQEERMWFEYLPPADERN